ncbi:MAG: hypothetical protein R3B07_11135 [Polyangiaceae bacterium]
MSDYQARIALARDAYRATQPTPSDVQAGTARVEAQLANPANHMRRLLQFLGGGALLGAGLLAALSDAPSGAMQSAALGSVGLPEAAASETAASEAAASQPSAGAPRLGLPQGWLQPLKLNPAASEAVDTAEAESSRAETARGARSTAKGLPPGAAPVNKASGAKSEPAAPPDWSQVSTALADGDPARADRVLKGLASNGDADTRAKALLGQAQLALSRGDRAEAKRLTRAAASVPGASVAVRDKALRWAARASL